MNAPPPLAPEPAKLRWFEHAWTAMPLALVMVGGAIGGACGGAAWAVNQQVFRKVQHPFWKYVATGLIPAAAVVAYFLLAAVFLKLLGKAAPR